MPITIKRLGPDDADVLDNVADVFDDAVVPESAKSFLADPKNILIAALDSGHERSQEKWKPVSRPGTRQTKVVGFVSAHIYPHPDKVRPELWINELGVAESHRRQGIATRLVQAALDEGRTANCRSAWVATESVNEGAKAFYASLPFASRPVDCIMYDLDLKLK